MFYGKGNTEEIYPLQPLKQPLKKVVPKYAKFAIIFVIFILKVDILLHFF